MVTSAQHRRVKAIAHYVGRPMRDVVLDALLKHIDEMEAKMEREAEKRREKRRREFVPRPEREWTKPRGLGIDPPETPSATDASTTSPPPPPRDARPRTVEEREIDRYVMFVLAGADEGDQERRIGTVTNLINETCASKADAKALAAKLDERIEQMRAAKKKDPRVGEALPWGEDE